MAHRRRKQHGRPPPSVPYGIKPGATRGMAGTDIEFARIGGRDYAFAGTYVNGLQIVDITDPTAGRPARRRRASRSCAAATAAG